MKKIIKTSVLIASTLCISNVFSGSMGQMHVEEPLRWAVNAGVGYGTFHYDGDSIIGRLSLSREMYKTQNGVIGLELGVQQNWAEDGRGRTFRFGQTNVRRSGIRAEVNPWVDLLATAQINLSGFQRTFVQLKGGVVYRNWDLRLRRNQQLGINQRLETNHSDIGLEGQAGFGYRFTETVSATLVYQGIVRASRIGGRNNSTLRSGLPINNAILFGVSVNV